MSCHCLQAQRKRFWFCVNDTRLLPFANCSFLLQLDLKLAYQIVLLGLSTQQDISENQINPNKIIKGTI